MKPERQNTRQRLDADLFLIRMPVVVDVLAYAADAVAAHFGLRAVRIEHPHPKIRLAGIGGRANENEPVAAYAKVRSLIRRASASGLEMGALSVSIYT